MRKSTINEESDHTKKSLPKRQVSAFALRLRSRRGEGNGGLRGKAGGGLCCPLSVPPYYEDSIVKKLNIYKIK
ncbi:hypothetical protein ABLW17_02125 [Anaerococcus murdochii]|uniref:hypothetical protein n=1 Tax=Anaerococcus murdochii TaxID=411577 RepID=UPI0032B5EEC9